MAGKALRSVKHPPIQVGDTFGRLTVVSIAEPDKRGQTHWHCRCECGTIRRVMANNLKRGNTTNCGCASNRGARNVNYTHGLSHLPEHAHWVNIFCRLKNNPDYAGRYMCQRWRDSFPAFLEDMGSKPTPDHSMERIDNDGNYTCGHCDECKAKGDTANCRWATFTEQMRNTTRSRRVTCNGKTATLGEWAESLGVSYNVVYQRHVKGVPVDGST